MIKINQCNSNNEELTTDSGEKKKQRYNICVPTKVNKPQYDLLCEITKNHFKLDSLYQLIQLFFAVLIEFDSIEKGASNDNEDEIYHFIAPFLDVDDKFSFMSSFKKTFGLQPFVRRTECYDYSQIEKNKEIDKNHSFISLSQIQEQYGIGKDRIVYCVKNGYVRAVRKGNNILYDQSDVEALYKIYKIGKGNILKAIVIRDGGFVESFWYDENGEPKISRSIDSAALDITTAGRQNFRDSIKQAMSAYKTQSFTDLMRILLKDAQEDINYQMNNNSSHYTMVEYGNVPVRTRNTNESSIIYEDPKHRKIQWEDIE